MLELIDREIERVGAIVHQMYQLYGRAPQRATEFDLAQTVREVVDLLSRVARKRGVSLQRETGGRVAAGAFAARARSSKSCTI